MEIKVDITEYELNLLKEHCEVQRDTEYGCDHCFCEDQCAVILIVQQECNFQYSYDPIDFDDERIKEILRVIKKKIVVV